MPMALSGPKFTPTSSANSAGSRTGMPFSVVSLLPRSRLSSTAAVSLANPASGRSMIQLPPLPLGERRSAGVASGMIVPADAGAFEVSRGVVMRHVVSAIFFAATLAFTSGAQAQVPSGYPGDYAKVIDAAKKEGKVVIYATTDAVAANPLIKDFESLYPGIKVEYSDLNSTELYNRFIAEAAANNGTADVLWSSAMDLQVKLVADGQATTYESPEIKALPKWAVWKNEAFGTTYEPSAFVYN